MADTLKNNMRTIYLDLYGSISSLDHDGGIFYGYRTGDAITLVFRGKTRSHTEDEVVATVPEAIRPKQSVYFIGMAGGTCCVMILNTNGNISIYNNYSLPAQRIHFNFSYGIAA